MSLRTSSTLGALVSEAEGQLGGSLSHASFRGEDGRPVTLLADGRYPAGGSLLVGPETTLGGVGLDSTCMINVQVAAKKTAGASKRKPAAKKESSKKPKKPKRATDDDSDEDEDEDEDENFLAESDADDDEEARRVLGSRARAALDGGAKARGDRGHKRVIPWYFNLRV